MSSRTLDFVYDQFANGLRFRVLNIVDQVTKECLGAIPDTSISGRGWLGGRARIDGLDPWPILLDKIVIGRSCVASPSDRKIFDIAFRYLNCCPENIHADDRAISPLHERTDAFVWSRPGRRE